MTATNLANASIKTTGATASRTFANRLTDAGVYIPDFGTVSNPFYGGGGNDDIIPIQAAIDYAHANNIRNVIYPDTAHSQIYSPIFMGPPADETRGGGG